MTTPRLRRIICACLLSSVASWWAVGAADARPVAFWSCDEGNGRSAEDRSGNWNHAWLNGATWCEGKIGSGLCFGGTDANTFVEVPDAESLRLDGPFTIQFWWRKVSSAVQIFIRKGGRPERTNYYAYLEGNLHFSVADAGGQVHSVTAPAPPDGWHHLALTYDGARLAIHVDGQTVGSRDVRPIRPFTDDSPLFLGTYAPGYRYCLAGTLDEVCLSDEAVAPEAFEDELTRARSLRRPDVRVETFAPGDGALVLAKDGVPGATIVIREDASRLQIVPAQELQAYLHRITGARLAIRDDGEAVAGNLVLVGQSRLTRELGLPKEPLTGDSFVIKATDGRLALLGNDAVMGDDEALAFRTGQCKWGTSNAVHTFLHDYCGVRSYMPGKLGEVVPTQAALEVPPIDALETPARTYALGGPWRGSSATWARRNLLGSSVFIRHPGGHLWYSLIPAKDYFADHPEWFALRDGKRVGDGNHLCTTNAEMRAEALANLRAIYDEGYEWVELGQTDGYQRCRCAECESVDEYRDPSGYWIPERPADRIHLFHAALADGIREFHPGRTLVTIAYGPTGEIPHALDAFPDNVVVEFTHDPPELLERWGSFHGRFVAYVYWFGTYHKMGYGPKSSPEYVAFELRRLRTAGARGFFFCGGFDCWGTEAPAYYVAARLLRDPDLDEGELMSEFCQGLFGDVASVMEQYFERLFEAAREYRGAGAPRVEAGVPYRGTPRTPAEVYLRAFSDETLETCRRLLEEADGKAADEAVRRRVRFFRDGFEYTRLTALALRSYGEWERSKAPEARADLERVVRQREAFVDELLARQAANGADLPPVFDYGRDSLLLGSQREYESAFVTSLAGPDAR